MPPLLRFSCSVLLALTLHGFAAEPTPQGPEEINSDYRGKIVLNGLWKFQPATGPAASAPTKDWGLIPVPGSWQRSGWAHGIASLEGVVQKGEGKHWNDLGKTLSRAWYEREISIPAQWAGRKILLDFRRVSTDATLFVNEKQAGTIQWPSGTIDITPFVRAGQPASIRLLVVSTAEAGDTLVLMGDAAGQNFTQKSVVQVSGIVGEVFLESRPAAAHVSDVFVQPSFRNKEIALDVEITGLKAAGPIAFTARMLNETGATEKEFTQTITLTPAQISGGVATVRLTWPWPDPRLWDLGQPNLYNLRLAARGAGLDDEYPQMFGFREFWIEGRGFVLNGIPFRLRPAVLEESFNVEAMKGVISGLKRAGYTIAQQWPENHMRRGTGYAHRELFYDVASREGWPTIGVALSLAPFIKDSKYAFIWEKPGTKQRYQQLMLAELRKYRNYPSVLMWGTTANFFNQGQDQNPQYIGRKNYIPEEKETDTRKAGDEGLAMIRAADPTRPVFTHAGNRVGDVFTVNTYLNLIPLQEREEWLSEWAKTGTMPYLAIEFGNPLFCDVLRGRNGFGGATASEPLLTEFSTIMRGAAAYADESAEYRNAILTKHDSGQKWTNWHGNPSLYWDKNFQIFQTQFMTATWKSWRTAGITGGMIPWNMLDNSLYLEKSLPVETSPLPQPGMRGAWTLNKPNKYIHYLQPEGGWHPQEAALAFESVNKDALAWIVGPAERFTAKDHLFRPGEKIQKQAALLNDSRREQTFNGNWSATLDGLEIGKGEFSGNLAPAQTEFLPIEFALPTDLTKTTQGEISLSIKIGESEQADRFAFRVLPLSKHPTPSRAFIYDPRGVSSAWLKTLGMNLLDWDGKPSQHLLVVGRGALGTDEQKLKELESYVKSGGRVLMMAQDPEFLREQSGLRLSRNVSRQVYAVDNRHPILAGITNEELRDWSGSGTLLPPFPVYAPEDSNKPYSGWRWGNYGSVASAAWEKPHRSGWRPILECEFDLAYSPLMELDLGRGRLVFCGLDLEGREGRTEPMVEDLSRKILSYAATAPLSPRVSKVHYIGGEPGADLLKSLGVEYTKVDSLKPVPLAVIAPDSGVTEVELTNFLNSGGRALVLPQKTPGSFLGAKVEIRQKFRGSLEVPKLREFRGLSSSDLRIRTETEALVLTEGGEVLADGLFAVRREGNGVAVYTQVDPLALDTNEETYLRFTRWRQTRTLSQVLANLGASFGADSRIFHSERKTMPLAGEWKYSITQTFPASSHPSQATVDPGVSAAALALMEPETDESQLKSVEIPGMIPEFKEVEGEAILRTTIQVPETWAGQFLYLSLGAVDDYDEVWFNGKRVGATDKSQVDSWNHKRRYRVPGSLVKPGKNVVALRVFDIFGEGGILANPVDINLRPIQPQKSERALYHADYREDFELGDEPYRYYRW